MSTESPAVRATKRARTPTMLQMEAVECGAASLGMVLAYYGRYVPLEELRATCGVSRDGAKAKNVVQAARRYGMNAQGFNLSVEEASSVAPPFIVFWNFNHFLVVEGFTRTHVYVNDPAMGPRKLSLEEFDRGFTGIVLEITPGADFKKGGRQRSLLEQIGSRLRGSERTLGFIMAVSLMLVLPGLVLPAAMKTFVNDILVRGFNDWVFPLVIGLALGMLLNGALTFLQQRYLLRLQTKMAVSLAAQFFWHVLSVPVDFYAQRYVGDVAARVQSCHRFAYLISGPLPTNLVNSLMVVFYLLVMSFFSVVLTLAVVALTLINVAAVLIVQRRRRDLNAVELNQAAKLVGASMAGVQSIETLKATGTESEFFASWAGQQTNTVNTHQRLGFISNCLDAVPGLTEHLVTIAALGGGALLVVQGELTIGGLVAFQMLLPHFSGPINALVTFSARTQEIVGDLNRIEDAMRYATDPLLQQRWIDPDTGNLRKLSGAVEIDAIDFGYSPLSPPLIEGFSLTVSPGQRVALVGSSGSGKSTLAKLMLGLYQPSCGLIRYDGRPIDEIPRPLFASSVGYVDQDVVLLEGSIAENLSLWDETISQGAIVRAAKDACIHDEIASRPGGYNGAITELGANFSGGQRQRLEIARALAREPNLLVLDEATSALDAVTEKAIDDNLRRRGCTCIIIAHRLSTIRDCDQIIVLDGGKIVDRGAHAELIARQGLYADLVESQ